MNDPLSRSSIIKNNDLSSNEPFIYYPNIMNILPGENVFHFFLAGHHYYLPNCWYTWLVLSLLPILFIIGVIVQLVKTSKGVDHRLGKKRFLF